MLNTVTGAALVLPANAQGLRRLHERALMQFANICEHLGLHGPGVYQEMRGFDAGFTFGATRDRSLLSSLNVRKGGFWLGLEQGDRSLEHMAATDWNGLFKHPALGRDARWNSDYHRPLDLLRERLMTSADIFAFNRASSSASRSGGN